MSFKYMPFFVGDHLRDTGHLTTEQQGAYLLLIFAYWAKKGPLPDDDQQLARIAGLSLARWRKMRPIIEGFFYDCSGGCWRHKRIDSELAKAKDLSVKRQEAANKSWQKRGSSRRQPDASSDANADASAMHLHADGDASAYAKPMQPPGYGSGYGSGYQ